MNREYVLHDSTAPISPDSTFPYPTSFEKRYGQIADVTTPARARELLGKLIRYELGYHRKDQALAVSDVLACARQWIRQEVPLGPTRDKLLMWFGAAPDVHPFAQGTPLAKEADDALRASGLSGEWTPVECSGVQGAQFRLTSDLDDRIAAAQVDVDPDGLDSLPNWED